MPYGKDDMNRFSSTTDFTNLTEAQRRAWEQRMRRALAAQGLILRRSRRRIVEATDFGLYSVSDLDNLSLSGGYTLSAGTIEEWAHS